MYVFCILVYPLHPGLTHIPGIGARQVSSLSESRVYRLQSPQLPYINLQLMASLFSYGTAKSGVGISATSVLRPDLMMKNSVPVVMAGIIAVSGYILLQQKRRLKLVIQRSMASSSRFSSQEIVCNPVMASR